jgi:hypothetical protein
MRTDISEADPNGGFLCPLTHWRPNPADPNPSIPGQKQFTLTYIPREPDDTCLCGTGKTYRACCQPRRHWHPVCPNPGMEGHSLIAPQSAKIHPVNGLTLREQLTKDTRLHCVEDSVDSGFWIFWGDPAIEDQYGILCFGDFELKQNRTLLVTAMSNLSMQTLLKALEEITEDALGKPQIRYDRVQTIDKRAQRGSLRRLHRMP